MARITKNASVCCAVSTNLVRMRHHTASKYIQVHAALLRKLYTLSSSPNIRKKLSLKLITYKKINFRGIILEGFQKGGPLKSCQNICLLNICRYKIN